MLYTPIQMYVPHYRHCNSKTRHSKPIPFSVPPQSGVCGGSLYLTHITLGLTPDIRTVCIIGAGQQHESFVEHGFVRCKSTCTNLLECLNDWTFSIQMVVKQLLCMSKLARHLMLFSMISYLPSYGLLVLMVFC